MTAELKEEIIEASKERIKGSKSYKNFLTFINSNNNLVIIKNLSTDSLALVLSTLSQELNRPLLIVTPGEEKAEQLYDDLGFFQTPETYHFSKPEVLPYELEEPHPRIIARHMETLKALSLKERSSPPIIVTTIEALLLKMPSISDFRSLCLHINQKESLDTGHFASRLRSLGYKQESVVENRAEFSIRGGIIDIYPPDREFPVRIDLFGTEIESIRLFDPVTQRSLATEKNPLELSILPAKETLILHQLINGGKTLVPLANSLPPETLVVFDSPEKYEKLTNGYWELIRRQYDEASARSEDVPQSQQLFTPLEEVNELLQRFQHIEHYALAVEQRETSVPTIIFQGGSFENVPPSLSTYTDLMKQKLKQDFLVHIVCDNEGQVMRFDELLREEALGTLPLISMPDREKEPADYRFDSDFKDVILSMGELHNGFILLEAKLLFITDREVFGRYKRRHVYRKVYKGIPVAAPAEIKRGDYVVHVDHGIGRFQGLRRQLVDKRNIDFLEIVYQDDDRLLVPVERIQHVQKYTAVEGIEPALDRLGSKKWLQRKRKSQESIEKLAQELLQLYARRTVAKGYAFSSDTVWQREFEASFIYEETPDQLKATEEVKADMYQPQPMDRLVCGDVGYGKTEVAIRAAFKAVQDNKQIAVLVPTTILAQQHYTTFHERFAGYPVRIELLSRFKTHREQKKIIERLATGEIDIIVGTHRLLSRDVRFFELGLVVVDEEQRFGVRHKEQLKKLRASVDFLTLTATPIPRTLYMALSGIRDMSLINTPPPGRLPIKTRIIHFDEEQIKEAILRELNRGGQVFFVHNRIESIDQIAQRLKEIVPQARIAVAFGRMKESQLEQVMLDFIDGKYDMLVSTTIIESGIDIPNVNTIIINRADWLGLAQLYHLRGRVGRDIKRAYAYLIVPEGQPITDAAVQRLQTIEEFTELGSGFQIAMRDMQIRGTGNILGREQHGCITAIGFELYCQLLEETVRRLKGEEPQMEKIPEITCRLEAFIPAEYIPVEAQRLAFYKKLALASNLEALTEITEELRDRFGSPPPPIKNLIFVTKLRVLAAELFIERIEAINHGFRLISPSYAERLLTLLESTRAKMPLIKSVELNDEALQINFSVTTEVDKVNQLVRLLQKIKENVVGPSDTDLLRNKRETTA